MNRNDIVARALRRLGVVAQDEAPDAQQIATGIAIYEAMIADANGPWGGCALPFTDKGTVPAAYQWPVINLLATRLAAEYSVPEPMPEITALMRLRAVNRPYVRDMDLDENGIVEPAEIEAVERSRWY